MRSLFQLLLMTLISAFALLAGTASACSQHAASEASAQVVVLPDHPTDHAAGYAEPAAPCIECVGCTSHCASMATAKSPPPPVNAPRASFLSPAAAHASIVVAPEPKPPRV